MPSILLGIFCLNIFQDDKGRRMLCQALSSTILIYTLFDIQIIRNLCLLKSCGFHGVSSFISLDCFSIARYTIRSPISLDDCPFSVDRAIT